MSKLKSTQVKFKFWKQGKSLLERSGIWGISEGYTFLLKLIIYESGGKQ
jgi:hypothetical protein